MVLSTDPVELGEDEVEGEVGCDGVPVGKQRLFQHRMHHPLPLSIFLARTLLILRRHNNLDTLFLSL